MEVSKHNCWQNCELTQALQCLAPAYGDEAHRKVATKMKQDMDATISPGPYSTEWTVTRAGCDIVSAEGGTVATVRQGCGPNGTLDHAQMVRNAHAIQALPDLLAALEFIATATRDIDSLPMASTELVRERARAAISKVKGSGK